MTITDHPAQDQGRRLKAAKKPYLTREDFPAAGDNRFWRLSHNPRSSASPVTIELLQYTTDTRHPSFATLLIRSGTIADKEAILEEAGKMLVRVGRIDDVVGVY